VAHDWVLVHDAARCLITPAQINGLLDACLDDEVGGLLALPLPDTLKAAKAGRVSATLPRADKWLAQTPQMFRIGSLLEALELAGDAVTDESSAIEAMGLAPKLVVGSAQNFKVTYPEDFELAQAVLVARGGFLAG
jgi:2-C-methyl-D-erythritol 4-phosphate cytidylyltransferase